VSAQKDLADPSFGGKGKWGKKKLEGGCWKVVGRRGKGEEEKKC